MISFEKVATAWYEKNRKAWALKTQDNRLSIFNNHIFPKIGDKPITAIKSKDILNICKPLEDEGKTKLTHIICQLIRRVFSYAVVAGYVEYNPATEVHSECIKHQEKHHPFLDFYELPKFFKAIQQKGKLTAQAKRAFLIIILTALRSGEVMNAKWSEIDLANKKWVIPAHRMKMRKEHTVPLSDIVIHLLNEQKKNYPNSDYIFPCPNYREKALNAWSLSRAIHHAGYGGRQVLHGFRHIFATHCYESNKWRDDVIETSLAHKITGIKGVYNKAKYYPERTKLMNWYANQIKKIAVDLL